MKINRLYLFFLIIFTNQIFAQLGVNATSSAPNARAMLDVESPNKGILIPRMNTSTRDGIASPPNGLMIYNNQTNKFNYFDGAAWQETIIGNQWSISSTGISYSGGSVGIGLTPLPGPTFPSGNVTNGRLQIQSIGNGDQLTIRHSTSPIIRWGFYASSIDSSLNFYYNGLLRANIDRVTGVYSVLSDKNLKKNIATLNPVLNNVLKLKAFNYNMADSDDNGRKSMGFMAQDVQPLFPELVYNKRDRETNEPFLMMDYSSFGVIAIKAIQEQQTIINSLQSQIDELKKLVGSMKK